MSTLQMLDAAIGVIFIFLLLSLVCSAASEVIESLLKKRAADLQRGIKEMLQGSSSEINESDSNQILEKFYKHPLISGLFEGKYNSRKKGNLPSYIPSRNFALTVLDMLLPANASNLSGASGGSSNADAVREISPEATDVGTIDGSQQPVQGDTSVNPLIKLREAVLAMPASNAKQALLTLIDAAGNDMNKVRENIEMWYNSSMDRVAGWYKRRVHWILLTLGFVFAVALNADTIAIFKSLMKDAPLRNSLVAATQEYAKTTTVGDATAGDPRERVEQNIKRLNDLRLPMGWDWKVAPRNTGSAAGDESSYVNNAALAVPPAEFLPWLFKVIGWLLTALAVSQGAPFWFDLLNKVMVVRSTVKPREKSKDEASEDRQNK